MITQAQTCAATLFLFSHALLFSSLPAALQHGVPFLLIHVSFFQRAMPRRQATAAGLLALAEKNGYRKGTHTEQDQVKDERRHNAKTKQNHDGTLNRYVLWRLAYAEHDCYERGAPVPSKETVHSQYLARGAPVPELATVKDFIRFYIHTSESRLADKMTTDSSTLR